MRKIKIVVKWRLIEIRKVNSNSVVIISSDMGVKMLEVLTISHQSLGHE